MTLLQMSFSGAILILAISGIRMVAINRLPKKTFLILWWVALLRLLLPFSVPSMLSAYSFVNQNASVHTMITGTSAANFIPVAPTRQISLSVAMAETQTLQDTTSVSIWSIIWILGVIFCTAFFLLSYLRCRFEFQTSLPVFNDFAAQWLKEHQLKRPITIRQSSRILAPLTYGIFHPIILMPKNTDWENKEQLQYVLLHEYVHICRYDTVTKLLSTFALCIHWFNPMVWVMYLLFNRDIELACDERVVQQFGTNTRSAYALALINMEEKKSALTPFCNNFSKNAIEERITAIMKIKKTSLIAILTAVILIVGVSTAFATSAVSNQQPLSDLPSAAFTNEEYEKLLALQYDGYEKMSIAEYRNKILNDTDTAKYWELLEKFWQDDTIYHLRDTNEISNFLCYTLMPLISENWQTREFDGYAVTDYPDNSEQATLEYCFRLDILDADKVTVGEYQAARSGMYENLHNILADKSTEELQNELDMQEYIQIQIDSFLAQWENDNLKITIQDSAYMPLSNYQEEDEQAWLAQRQMQWDNALAAYVPFGLTYAYDSSTDDYKMYFQGKEVRGIFDEAEGLWITEHAGIGTYDENAVELYAVYENGQLVGLRESTEEEQAEWSQLRQQITEQKEKREHPYGIEEDYTSLLSLKTANYQTMPLSNFNARLLEWTNENYERMERIHTDTAWNDTHIALSDEEKTFVTLTVWASGIENAKLVQSNYTGNLEQDPVLGGNTLNKQEVNENNYAAWCSMYYQFSYHIPDKSKITVGERDRCVGGMLHSIQTFWDESSLDDLLAMNKSDIVSILHAFAKEYSNEQISIHVKEEDIGFEYMDERNLQ